MTFFQLLGDFKASLKSYPEKPYLGGQGKDANSLLLLQHHACLPATMPLAMTIMSECSETKRASNKIVL